MKIPRGKTIEDFARSSCGWDRVRARQDAESDTTNSDENFVESSDLIDFSEAES